MRPCSTTRFLTSFLLFFGVTLVSAAVVEFSETHTLDSPWTRSWTLEEGDALELSVRIDQPSALLPNSRIEAIWDGPDLPQFTYEAARGEGVSATTDWSKVLHALDPDVYLVYRAPISGTYTLKLKSLEEHPQPLGEIPHDTGLAPLTTPLPTSTPHVNGSQITIDLHPVEALASQELVLEAEPNNAPEQAIDLLFEPSEEDQVMYVIGGADDIEYYNNTRAGKTPDDWYRIHYKGDSPKFLSANLQLVEPVVSPRIRFYREGVPSEEELQKRDVPNSFDFSNFNPLPYVHPPATAIPGPVQVYTYEQGRAINERAHQQDRSFRSFITRKLEPGHTYYLRVEANQPHYEMQVRLFNPAPYDDPVQAVQQGIFYHLAEIDAWLIHRPRNIASHRRVRDATALFGENCMSCHTQSGVWGVADAFRNGYRPDGVEQNYRRVVNTMYESLRLTNKLKDAAVNTSVAPNDLGDGPAGTRVAGRNIVLHERTHTPKKLHAHWQRRTANYILQTADPKGINAAGRGSNFGPNVVFKFAAEILERAWQDFGDPRYFFALEEKAHKIVATDDKARIADDFSHRIEFFYRIWPQDYVEQIAKLTNSPQRIAAAKRFQEDFKNMVSKDLRRVLALQHEDGGWGFIPGHENEDGEWVRPADNSYPAPTAVSLIALEAAGYRPDDPVIQKGVQWLLQNQYPYGLWNAAAATGFVTTAYVLRALGRLYPNKPQEQSSEEFEPRADNSFLASLMRARNAQATGDPRFADLFIKAAQSSHPQVRLYGLLGLGGARVPAAVPTLVQHFDDPVKSCREAAFWSLRQLLLDDVGWEALFDTYRNGNDRARQSVFHALITRAYLAGSNSKADSTELTSVLTAGMVDHHPGVRAYASKAAWHWWVWNPSLREPINRAWLDVLTRPEPEANVDMALRYSTISLFIVNGQMNNITSDKYLEQQYPELSTLYQDLALWRESATVEERRLVDRRLTAMAASHYMERSNQQSPGQFAYSTPGAAELYGKAVLEVYENEIEGKTPWKTIALEGARNITYQPLQDTILELLLTADQDIVAIAARALSNPGELSLPALTSMLEPLLRVMTQYAAAGRELDADAVANFLARVKWDFEGIAEDEESAFYRMLQGISETARSNREVIPASSLGRPATQTGLGDTTKLPKNLVARILGENRTLHRKEAFSHLSSDPRLWLDSTEWMLSYQEGGPTLDEAIEGALEAEELEITQLTFGRTTEQTIPGGVASHNGALLWEEGKTGAQLSFALEVPQPGSYDLIGAFLYGASHGIVEISFNGRVIAEHLDLYRPEVTSTGPMALGVFELPKGRSVLTIKMFGTSEVAEPEYKFGIDYLKLAPNLSAEIISEQDGPGGEGIDPIIAAKIHVLDMFIRWFSPDTPVEIREIAVNLAGSPALRRNPELRKTVMSYVEQEPVAIIRTRLENLLANDDEQYGKDLRDLIKQEAQDSSKTIVRRLEPTDEFIQDILYFKDHVFFEMNKISEHDNHACISCHGVPGRVPTLYLNPPDGAGHIGPAELLANYRKLQERVEIDNPELSLFLRKPLNIQSGQEEGHQGGQRYEPDDDGFQILHNWVLKQAELQGNSDIQ